MNKRRDLFKEFLNFLWLRPENALLHAVRAEKYAGTASLMGDNNIDISCGNGVFSFISMGGALADDTDMFRSLDLSKNERSGDFDVFDKYDDSYFINIVKKPDFKYSIGTDWKENLLKKADHLSYYEKLIVHDNNKILPIDNESMDYIFSNSTYWVDNFEQHLLDLTRILKSGGHLVIQIKTLNIINTTSRVYAPFMGDRFHETIDAGRLSTWKSLRSIREYESIFSKLNMEVLYKKPIYGGLIMKMWDIGLRPIFIPLSKMVNSLSRNNRSEIKKEWCDIFSEIFEQFIDEYQCSDEEAVEWLYVFEKK
jgi:SAM-dependent methyltransferase